MKTPLPQPSTFATVRQDAARAAAWGGASRLLAVRLDNLGDVLMTTPAMQALAGEQREVTLLTSRSGAAAAPHLRLLSDVLVHDAAWVQGQAQGFEDDRRFLAELAERRFDGAVIFTVCTQSALPAAMFLRLAGIPLRLAYSRENPYALLTDTLRDTEVVGPGMRHEVVRQLELVNSVGFRADDTRLHFDVFAADRASVHAKLAAAAGGRPQAPFIVVHPGSTAASRRYPPERFGIAAGRLAMRSGAQLVLAGGPGEAAACELASRASGLPCLNLAGQLSLGELAALIDEAMLLVCNNSGPAHLAAARGTPVVVLYALTNPQHTPWTTRSRVLSHEVPCRDCLRSVCPQGHHACLLGIDPAEIVEAGLALIHEGRGLSAFAPPGRISCPP